MSWSRTSPVWAIGTGEVATPEDAQEMAAAIRARLEKQYGASLAETVRVLVYGGSRVWQEPPTPRG